MGRTPQWEETLHLLSRHPSGLTKSDIGAYLGIGEPATVARIRALRDALQEHPELGLALPRPTVENGWVFRLTSDFIDPGQADIRSGHLDDAKNVLGILERNYWEKQRAIEKEIADNGAHSARVQQLLGQSGTLAAVIKMIKGDSSGMASMNGTSTP